MTTCFQEDYLYLFQCVAEYARQRRVLSPQHRLSASPMQLTSLAFYTQNNYPLLPPAATQISPRRYTTSIPLRRPTKLNSSLNRSAEYLDRHSCRNGRDDDDSAERETLLLPRNLIVQLPPSPADAEPQSPQTKLSHKLNRANSVSFRCDSKYRNAISTQCQESVLYF